MPFKEKALTGPEIDTLTQIYSRVAGDASTTVWDATREAEWAERQKQLEVWGQELRDSKVGESIEAIAGLYDQGRSPSGQDPDSFKLGSSESNELSLHYHKPNNIGWSGELIRVGLTFSQEGQETWSIKTLDGIHTVANKTVGVYKSSEFANEEAASEFLNKYIQTHGCAKTLRNIIQRNLEMAEIPSIERVALEA